MLTREHTVTAIHTARHTHPSPAYALTGCRDKTLTVGQLIALRQSQLQGLNAAHTVQHRQHTRRPLYLSGQIGFSRQRVCVTRTTVPEVDRAFFELAQGRCRTAQVIHADRVEHIA